MKLFICIAVRYIRLKSNTYLLQRQSTFQETTYEMKFGSSCILLFYICKLVVHFNTSPFHHCSLLVSAVVLVTKSLKCYKSSMEEIYCEDNSVCIKTVGCVFQFRNFGKIERYFVDFIHYV